MKKILLFIFLPAFLLTGCNTEKDVPEQLIEYVVEDYYNQYALESAVNYEYSSDSTWDNKTKTCTVNVKVSTEYAYGYIDAENSLVYEYSRSDDTWNLIRSGDWNESVRYDVEKKNEEEFYGEEQLDYFYNYNFYFTLKEINLEENYIVTDYQITEQYLIGYGYGENSGTVLSYSDNVEDENLSIVQYDGEDSGFYNSTLMNGESTNIPSCSLKIISDNDTMLELTIRFNIEGIEFSSLTWDDDAYLDNI